MAIDSHALGGWIALHGPYLFHVTSDDATRQKILREGLIPWDDGPGSSAWNDEPFLMPRPGHVYLGTENFMRTLAASLGVQSHTLLRVDLRRLDPQRVNPDEDIFLPCGYLGKLNPSAFGIEDPTGLVDDPRYNIGRDERPYASYGEWAEDIDFGRDGSVTEASLEYGAVSFRGIVAPAALEAVRVTGETVATAMLRPNAPSETQWRHLPVGMSLLAPGRLFRGPDACHMALTEEDLMCALGREQSKEREHAGA